MTTSPANTVPAPGARTGARRGRPPDRPRAGPSVLLRSLAAAAVDLAGGALDEALRRVWFSGFCAGAASAAPDPVRRCARCGEAFVAGHGRAIYCGARCRNTALKRRYRARLRARARAEDGPVR
jgi:hypothetical protein